MVMPHSFVQRIISLHRTLNVCRMGSESERVSKKDFFKRRLVMASKHAAFLVDLTFHSVPAWLHQVHPLPSYTPLCISLVPLQEKKRRKKCNFVKI